MSLLGLSSQKDYDAMAAKLRTYEGAEQFVIDQLAPVTNGVYQWMYPTVFLAFALIGLMWWAMRLAPARAARYLLTVAFISALMIPVEVAGTQVPASFYYFNFLTSQALGALQTVIDTTIRGPGGAGNYAATLHSLSPYSTGAGGDDLRGTNLADVVKNYGDYCGRAAVEKGNFTTAELQAVGLAGGVLGVDVPGVEKARVSGLQKMRGLGVLGDNRTPEDANSPLGQRGAFYIMARTGWLGRDGDKTQVQQLLTNNIPELQYVCVDGVRCETDKTKFFARDCADLYRIADMSAREYQAAIAARSKLVSQRAGISPGEDKDGLIVLGAQITAGLKVNESGREEQNPPVAKSNFVSSLLSGLESLFVTMAMKLVNWVAEAVTKWFVFAVPAVGALAVGLMFVAWPIVVLMSLVPGRETTVAEFLYYNVYIKFFLFFAYAILKVGGALFLTAVDQFARDGSGSLASMTFISGLAILIGVIFGASRLAAAVTFSQSRGLVGALGLGAVGGQQITQASRQLAHRGVNLLSDLTRRWNRGGGGGSSKSNLAGKGAPPQGSMRGSATGRGAGPTLKSVRGQVTGKKPPPRVG